jgi:hypothetical protein
MRASWIMAGVICLLICGMSSAVMAWIAPDCDRWQSRGVDGDEWVPLIEQHAGEEVLTIPVLLPEKPGAGWVIPIPARAEDVKVAWVSNRANCVGRTPESILHEKLAVALILARLTQIYPVVYEFIFAPSASYTAEIESIRGRGPVTTGMECRKVVAKTAAELAANVKQAGVSLTAEQIGQLEKAGIGGTYLIVTGHMADSRMVSRGNGRVSAGTRCISCLEVRFPTAQLLLPMRAAANVGIDRSGWGVCVTRHVMPLETLPREARVIHLYGTLSGDETVSAGGVTSYGREEKHISYTRLLGVDPMQELSLVPVAELPLVGVDTMLGLLTHPLVWVALIGGLIGGLSYISGGLTGLLFARQWRIHAQLGLWNLLTIFGLALRLQSVAGVIGIKSRGRYVFAFSAIFFGLTLLMDLVLRSVLGEHSWRWGDW